MNQPSLSYWERDSFFKSIDYSIVGSGIVGLSAAITLKKSHPKANVVILESGMIPSGASTRNAGFACFGSISELLDDLEHSTIDEVLELVDKRWSGLKRLQELVGDDLVLENKGGYELFRSEDDASFHSCKDKMAFFNEKLAPIIGNSSVYKLTDEAIPTFGFQKVEHLILNTAEGQIDTGSMMRKLLWVANNLGIRIFNGATVEEFEENNNEVTLSLKDGRFIKSGKVLIATNGFAQHLLDDLNVIPARNQVLITQPIHNLKVKGTFHYDAGYYYFRNVGDRILFGGGRNLSPKKEETDQFGTTQLIKENLLRIMKNIILPDTPFEVDMWWSGILGVGEIKQPIIKKVSENVAVSVRMGGMGVAIGALVGEEGAELING